MAFVQVIWAIVLFLVALSPIVGRADIWTVTQSWSPAMEQQYQTWIQSYAQRDIFARRENPDGRPNPYYGLKTDCADTVYALRIIFSYENGLPWAIRNPSDRSQLLTQEMSRFNHIPENDGQRIRAFIRYIGGVVSTGSLPNDTYPVSIYNIKPGTIILTSKKNHHSWTIAQIMPNGNPRLVFNSIVSAQSSSMLQERVSWPNPHWVFEPEERPIDRNNPDMGVTRIPVYRPDSYAGLRYWIPVDMLLREQREVPGYSNDQFALDLSQWKQILTRILATRAETIQEVVLRLLTDACADVHQRMEAINDAQTYRRNLFAALINADTPLLQSILAEVNAAVRKDPADNRCMIFSRYDEFSTPSRDKRLFDSLMVVRAYLQHGIRTQGEQSFSPQVLAQVRKIYTDPLISAREESASENDISPVSASSLCRVRVDGEDLDMAEIKRRTFRSYLSPNPNDDLAGRWGRRNGIPSDFARQCTTYGDQYVPYDLDRAEREAQAEVEAYARGTR